MSTENEIRPEVMRRAGDIYREARQDGEPIRLAEAVQIAREELEHPSQAELAIALADAYVTKLAARKAYAAIITTPPVDLQRRDDAATEIGRANNALSAAHAAYVERNAR